MKEYVRTVPNYPIPGIQFRDITPLLQDNKLFAQVVDGMSDPWRNMDIDAVLSIEARGFIMAGAIAYKLGAAFIPLRKPDKLPGDTHRVSFELEYGKTEMHIHKDALDQHTRLLIVDDLLATGGTVNCVSDLLNSSGKSVLGLLTVVELRKLDGRLKFDFPVESCLCI